MDAMRKVGGKSLEKERQDILSERLSGSRHKYDRNWRIPSPNYETRVLSSSRRSPT